MTIKDLSRRFKGRFMFQAATVHGSSGYRIIDTYKFKSSVVVGDDPLRVLEEIEQECIALINNGNNGHYRIKK